ncbi:MAG: DUF1304 domain-containing protein [Deltaproteobacteria bacterium]|nr:DUF1304 domain-containing protein [Deltaproteobacteria bacterium]
MPLASQVMAGIVALLHLYFLVLEMFLWTTPYGQATFKRTAKEQESSRVLAANQGLYNGFLAAGLVWSMITGDYEVRNFFFGCIVVAGVYGGATVGKQILVFQALPAVLGIVFTALSMT